jgi:hypothetical protein
VHLIGGADVAAELDAKRAINQGTRLAASIYCAIHHQAKGNYMTPAPTQLQPAVVASLAVWHDMVAKRDLSALPGIVHPDAVFRSPMAIHPYQPAAALILVLSTVIRCLKTLPTTASWRPTMA